MTSDCIQKHRPSAIGMALTIADLSRLWRAAMERWARRRTRRLLRALSDETLRDIGLERADVELTAFGRPYPRRPDRYL